MLVKVIIKAKKKLINVLAIIHFIYSHRRVQRKSHKNIEIRKTFHIGSNKENRKKSQKINREKRNNNKTS